MLRRIYLHDICASYLRDICASYLCNICVKKNSRRSRPHPVHPVHPVKKIVTTFTQAFLPAFSPLFTFLKNLFTLLPRESPHLCPIKCARYFIQSL